VNACFLSIKTESFLCFCVEHGVLVFSIFELCILGARWRAGIMFKSIADGRFIASDCVVVFICIIEKWGIPLQSVLNFDTGIENNMVCRTLMKMVWLFRFIRLIRIVPALSELAHGVMDAIQGLFWVLCFMLLLIYAIAILCTRLIGHYKGEEDAEVEEVQKMFRDVRTSMFYLFETMSSWTLVPLIPLFQIAPITRILFVLFYIYAGWTLLAVMTGVVSFNMIALRAQMTREDEVKEHDKKEKAKEVLMEIFAFSDADRSGELSHEEFDAMVSNPDIIATIQANTHIKLHDLEDLWHWLDDDSSDTISWEEFLRGFLWLNEPFKPKTLLRLQEKITNEVKMLKRKFHELITGTFDSIMHHVHPPMRKMHAVTEQVQLLEVACQQLNTSVLRAAEQSKKKNQMRAATSSIKEDQSYTLVQFENRIGAQIDEVLVRLERFRPVGAGALKLFNNPAAQAKLAEKHGVEEAVGKDPLLYKEEEEYVHHSPHPSELGLDLEAELGVSPGDGEVLDLLR